MLIIVVVIEMPAKPIINPFEMSKQSLWSFYITFMDSLSHLHGPLRGLRTPRLKTRDPSHWCDTKPE